MESVGSFAEELPVINEGGILLCFLREERCLQDHNADTSRAYVLLSTSVDHIILIPLNILRAEVAGHIAHHELTSRFNFVRESMEFKTLDCLIVAVVEEFSILFYVPFRVRSNIGVFQSFVICNLVGLAVLLSLSDSSL